MEFIISSLNTTTMSQADEKNSSRKLSNRSAMLFLSIVKAFTLLPSKLQLHIGALLGGLLYYISKRSRYTVQKNLKLCFPEKNNAQRTKLCKQTFKSLGQGAIEAINAWYMNDKRFSKFKLTCENQEFLDSLKNTDKPIIFFSAHFHPMEILARMWAGAHNAHIVYNRCKEPRLNKMILKYRSKHYHCIERSHLRKVIQILKNKGRVILLSDQNRVKQKTTSSFVPFFGVPCYTANIISKLPKLTSARTIFYSFYRCPGKLEYAYNLKEVHEPITPEIFNQLLEEAIRKHPEQYLWTHNRFKTYSSKQK